MTCKDCLSHNVCSKKHWHVEENKRAYDLEDIEKRCADFKDKSHYIEKYFAMVFDIHYGEIVFTEDDIGESVFLTKEEAEQN